MQVGIVSRRARGKSRRSWASSSETKPRAAIKSSRALFALLLVIAGGSIPSSHGAESIIQAGVAKRKVTPPPWVPYLTSSGNGTHAPFVGVHDDLYARALVFDDGRQSLAILAVDSIGYDNSILGAGRDFTRELRERAAAKTSLRPESIMLAASHTHSAPETIGLTPFREVPRVPQWIEKHLEDLAQAIIEAWQRRVPVRVRSGKTRVENFARYRRIVTKDGKLNRHGPVPAEADVAQPWALDEQLGVLYLETTDGEPHSILLNFTAHPVIAMLLPPVSADYPGAATRIVEQALPGSICLFTQGAAGNINALNVSTNFDDVDAAGRTLANAALAMIKQLQVKPSLEVDAVTSISESCDLDARTCPSVSEAEQRAAEDPSALNQRVLRLARKLNESPLCAEVQAMRVGPVKWVSVPGEPFVETGMALKRSGADFVVGYANGYLGYFPIRRAYAEGGYEAEIGPWSRAALGSAERLQEVGQNLLQRLSADAK